MATAEITPDNDAILAEVFIAAPPARVFEAIADARPEGAMVETERRISRD